MEEEEETRKAFIYCKNNIYCKKTMGVDLLGMFFH